MTKTKPIVIFYHFLFCGQRNPNLKFFLENMDTASSRIKRSGTIQLVIRACSSDAMEDAFVSMKEATCPCGKAPLILKVRQVLEQRMLPSRQPLSKERFCTSQWDNNKTKAPSFPTAWVCGRRVHALNWPTCSPQLWTFGVSWNKNYKKEDPQLLRT